MKVILYMAITVNGIVAKKDDDSSFTSQEDWDSLFAICKSVGNIVMGRRTYELMLEQMFPVPDCLNVIATTNKSLGKDTASVIFTDKSPKEIITLLEKKGFNEALIGGGTTLNTAFMTAGLIDEIYLDVEPAILGSGIPLFRESNFEFKLELLEVKNLSPQTIQLHYGVIKRV